jgi:hypothetical protein
MACDITHCPHNPDEACVCNIEACPCCAGLGVAARCDGCDGAGAICTRTLREAQLAHVSPYEKCEKCNGRGWFPITTALYERLGFGVATAADFVQRRKRPQPVPIRHAG